MIFLYLFVVVFFWRLLTYIFRLINCKKLYRKWQSQTDPTENQIETEAIAIFKECHCPYVSIDFHRNNPDKIKTSFNISIGYYKYGIKQNFYPNFWIYAIFKKPFLELAEASGKMIIEKFFQLILYAFCWLGGTIDFASVLSEEALNTLEIVHRLIDLIFK